MAAQLRALLQEARTRLLASGIASAELDAERLLRHVLGWDRARFATEAHASVPDAEAARFAGLIDERARRRPLQHLVGTQAFWRHEFRVTPDVLIPRPETELIVEHALQRLRGLREPRLADVGTGSGCIALSLAAELPAALVDAMDLSAAALAVARENARRLGLESRVQFHEGDLLLPVAGRRFDAVVSNPPYVDPKGRASLAPEVRDHEPALALFPPGDEPLGVYRRLAPQALGALRPGGFLIVEVGMGQADAVAGILGGTGFTLECIAPDLQGIPRTLVARRPKA